MAKKSKKSKKSKKGLVGHIADRVTGKSEDPVISRDQQGKQEPVVIDELTPEQEKMLDEKAKEWIEFAFNGDPIDQEVCTEMIQWLYEYSGLGKPYVLYVDSPMAAQYLANSLKPDDKNPLKLECYPNHHEVRALPEGSAVTYLEVNMDKDLLPFAKPRELDFTSFSSYGGIADYGWCSFYDFFESIGLEVTEDYKNFRKLLRTNIYDCIQLDAACICIHKPKFVHRNEQGRLHNTEGPAVGWADGFELYYQNGRNVPAWIYKEEITAEKFFGEQNEEIRAAMALVLGDGGLCELLDTEKIDKQYANGEELILHRTKEVVEDVEDKMVFVEVVCPSTGTHYFIEVPPQFTDAIEAVAWTYGKTKDQYMIAQHT